MNILKRLILRNCCCRRPKFQLDQDRVFTFVTHRAEHLLRKLYCFYSNFKPHSTGFVDLLVGYRPKSPPQFWVLARCKLFFNCTNLIESNDEQGRDQNISFQGIWCENSSAQPVSSRSERFGLCSCCFCLSAANSKIRPKNEFWRENEGRGDVKQIGSDWHSPKTLWKMTIAV